MINIDRILHPTDFSQNSAHALNYAYTMAQTFEAELHLIYVISEALVSVSPPMSGFLPEGYYQDVMESAESNLSQVLENDEGLKNRMEMDYWGLSYKDALQEIAEKDNSEIIKVAYETSICIRNANFLEDDDRERISFTKSLDSADYFVTNYRWHMLKDSSFAETLIHEPFYDLKVGESSIMTVWKLNE